MKQLRLILIVLFFPAWSHAHPLHLSVTNILFENGKLSISIKTFRADLETAYFHYNNRAIVLTDNLLQNNSWFKNYLNDRFRVSPDESQNGLQMEIDTVVLNEESIIIEMHTTTQVKANSLYIYNALLIDIYPDQTNLVIFGFNNRETGIKFDVKKHGAKVMLK
jgi:hypothetical protein